MENYDAYWLARNKAKPITPPKPQNPPKEPEIRLKRKSSDTCNPLVI
jgi:hypothetical protein